MTRNKKTLCSSWIWSLTNGQSLSAVSTQSLTEGLGVCGPSWNWGELPKKEILMRHKVIWQSCLWFLKLHIRLMRLCVETYSSHLHWNTHTWVLDLGAVSDTWIWILHVFLRSAKSVCCCKQWTWVCILIVLRAARKLSFHPHLRCRWWNV